MSEQVIRIASAAARRLPGLKRRRALRDMRALFDGDYYRETYPDVAESGDDPFEHYLRQGWAEGRNPAPLFHTEYYLEQNPDVAQAGINPLLHFVTDGAQEGRDPCPLFGVKWYLDQNPDVAEAGVNPLIHYLTVGWREGRNPNALFDSAWYFEKHPDVAAEGVNPFIHYVIRGKGAGRANAADHKSTTHEAAKFKFKNLDKPVIIYESHNLKLQGAPNSLFEIARGVKQRSHFHPIFMSNQTGPLADICKRQNIDCILHGVSQNQLKDHDSRKKHIRTLSDLYQRAAAKLVHVNTLQNFHCILAAHNAGVPAVWNIRESEDPNTYYDYLPPDLREMAYSCFEKAAAVIFVAESTRRLWLPWLDGKVENLTIRNGLDAARLFSFVSGTDRPTIRSALALSESDILILNIGTVIPRKGQLDLTGAIGRLDESIRRRVVLAIVGLNTSHYAREVQEQLNALEEQGVRVIAVAESASEEQRRTVAELYLSADIFVLTSRIESYPRVTLEAMEFGLPIISTPCYGVREQVVEGESALFYNEGDIEQLAAHICFLAEHPEQRREFGRAARNRLKVLNNYEQMLDAYENVYNRILTTRSEKQETPRATQPPPDQTTSSSRPLLSILVISRTAENMNRLLVAIADNGVDASYEILCSWNGDATDASGIRPPDGVDFRLVEQRPYNFAANNNSLARQAHGEFVLFLNDDVIPDQSAIGRALDAVRDPSVGIVGINLRYQDGRLQHAGVFFDEQGKPYHRLKHKIMWDDPKLAVDMFVPCVTGAFILMRRSEFNALQFDENFHVCGEDIALNLSYRETFDREILYVADATAIHIENATRKKSGETKTPPEDMERILTYSGRLREGRPLTEVRRPRVRIVTEKPGWIMHRKAEEIRKHMGEENVRINEDWPEADIHYYINYGYFRAKPKTGLTVANFTHYDPDHLADKFVQTAYEVDHCIAVSEATADVLRGCNVPDDKISVILVGADRHFQPKLTVGVSGRVYPGGRKGEDIVRALLDDPEVMSKVCIVATQEGWGAPVWRFDNPADFYRAIDYLLVPSRLEGGPVPFMEALACGTMSIAPEIGVVPQFPHISYPAGDADSLKAKLLSLAEQHISQRRPLSDEMRGIDWSGWAVEHEKLFRRLLS